MHKRTRKVTWVLKHVNILELLDLLWSWVLLDLLILLIVAREEAPDLLNSKLVISGVTATRAAGARANVFHRGAIPAGNSLILHSALLHIPGSPHHKPVPHVHLEGSSIQMMVLLVVPQQSEPLVGKSLPVLPSLEPDPFEVAFGTDVLSNGYGVIQIDDGMPPSSRHKHCLARILDALYHLR